MSRIALAALAVVFMVAAVPVHAQGVPGADVNKCLAGKNKCVSKKIAGLMKCREKCQKKPDKCGQPQADCEQKVMDKFDGGTNPAKGCFAKLEAKADPAKPESVCTTTGDTAAVGAEVDAEVASLLGRLEGTSAPTCGDGVVNVVGEQCDGADLDGATCVSLGHTGVGLTCNGSCDLDTSTCADCATFGGTLVGGSCWFLSSFSGGESCTTACANAALAYDDATRTYAGSDGGDAECEAVITALGFTFFGAEDCNTFVNPPAAVGCTVFATPAPLGVRCTAPPTTAEASSGPAFRACACR